MHNHQSSQIRFMRNFFNLRRYESNIIFNGHYIDVKSMYVSIFDKIPGISFMGELDMTMAMSYIQECYANDIRNIYQHCYYDYDAATMLFNNTIFVLSRARMIELADGYIQILYTPRQYAWARELVNGLVPFRMVVKTEATRIVGFARQADMN